MATETPASPSANADEKPAPRVIRKSREIDVEDLEKRVHLAELRAREAEAELRYVVAVDKRKAIRLEGRGEGKGKRREKGKRRREAASE